MKAPSHHVPACSGWLTICSSFFSDLFFLVWPCLGPTTQDIRSSAWNSRAVDVTLPAPSVSLIGVRGKPDLDRGMDEDRFHVCLMLCALPSALHRAWWGSRLSQYPTTLKGKTSALLVAAFEPSLSRAEFGFLLFFLKIIQQCHSGTKEEYDLPPP